MGRMNFAPRMPTIIVALAFVLIGLLGTFVGVLPEIAGGSARTSARGHSSPQPSSSAGMLVEGI